MQPLLRAFVSGYVGLMRGDEAALRKAYRLTFSGSVDGHWTLVLVPRDSRLQRLIARITIDGKGKRVASMRLDEGSGDHSITTFSAVNSARVYTDGDRAKVFRLQ